LEKTGGRQRGTPNRLTLRRKAELAASGLSPVDFLLQTMRNEELDLATRLDAAKAVAPFIHPRLSAIDASVRTEATAVQLTDQERIARARAMIAEAFAERPEPPVVIAGKPVLHLIEHEPASDEAKSGEHSDRFG